MNFGARNTLLRPLSAGVEEQIGLPTDLPVSEVRIIHFRFRMNSLGNDGS